MAAWLKAAGSISLAALAAGCAAAPLGPGFPVSPPSPSLGAGGKAIAIIGDTQLTPWLVRAVMQRESNREAQRVLVDDLTRRGDDLALLAIAGDLVFTAKSRRDWRHFDELIGPLARRVPVLPAIGNHDYPCVLVRFCHQDEIAPQFRARFPWFTPGQPYFVAYGDVALVFIDSETALEAQGEWLREWLREHEREFAWALILTHRPPYSDSLLPGIAPDTAVQEHIVAALAGTTLVPAVISGHAHGYEHQVVGGIHFIVTAGGGGPRGKLDGSRPHDVYAGPNCARDAAGQVIRPFNYLLVQAQRDALHVTVRGLCEEDAAVDVLESFTLERRAP